MKIWFPVVTGHSGADVYTRRLANALNQYGVVAEISWFPATCQFVPKILSRTMPPPGTDIIHTNTWSAFAFKRSGIPLVATEHQGVYSRKRRPYRNLAQRIYHTTLIRRYVLASIRCAAAVTTVSRFSAAGISETLQYNSARVIHNWIDTNVFTPVPEKKRDNSKFKLLFMGNLGWLKGADILVSLMSRLGSGFELYVASGLKNKKFKQTAENIMTLGSLNNEADVVRAYQRCDAVLVPSRFEGFGYIPLEAMACGKPVIASDVGAIPEVVANGVTSILCPAGNIEAFVSACQRLATRPDLIEAYGRAGRQRAENLFTKKRIVPQYLDLYREIVSA
jgi:glycosyltransferase involved in cell wall biosynthesis